MRKLWLCSAVAMLAASVCMASELQFDMFPGEPKSIEIDLFGSEPAKQEIEFDLFAGVTCPCPDGPCICDTDKCPCPDCPEHSKEKPTVWAGKPNEHGKHAKIVSSDECAPCQTFKASVKGESQHIEIENYATLKGAGEAGYNELPQCKLYENGELKLILVGGACKEKRVKDWLNNKSERVVNQSRTYSSGVTCSDGSCRITTQPAFYRPSYQYRPTTYFRSYSSGCATCK